MTELERRCVGALQSWLSQAKVTFGDEATLAIVRAVLAEAGDADARLIAAAPDLLAAAQRSLQGWENAVELGLIPTRHTDTATSLASDLRAAIAKATGKQEG